MAFLLPILLKYVLPGLLLASLVGYGGYKVHEDGRMVERAIWQERELKQQEAAKEALLNAHKLAAFQAAEHRKQLEELTNAKKQAIKTLKRDVADLSKRGLYITASACPDPGSTEAADTSGVSSTPGRIRLPFETETNLISMAEDAQQVVIQYNACRAELMQIADVLPTATD